MIYRWWVRRPTVSLANKVVIVTGASSGIGRATARHFARADCHVVLVARREQPLQQVKHEIDTVAKHPALIVAGDVSNDDDLERIVSDTMQQYGRIDILINNAGISPTGAFQRYTRQEIRDMIDINLYGAVRLTHLVIPIMLRQDSGHIVNIGSVSDINRPLGHAVYNATRSGLAGFSDSLLREVKSQGIHVTTVLPGWTHTPLLTTAPYDQAKQMLTDAGLFTPGMTLDRAEDVAQRIVTAVRCRHYRVILGGWMFQVLDVIGRISPRLMDVAVEVPYLTGFHHEATLNALYEESHPESNSQ